MFGRIYGKYRIAKTGGIDMSEVITDEKFDALIKSALHEVADYMEASYSLKGKTNAKIKLSQQVELSEYAKEIYQ